MDVVIGVIAKPHGIRGEVKVIPQTVDVRRFGNLRRVRLQSPQFVREFEVEKHRYQGESIVLLKLGGIDDRSSAETLRGAHILVDEVDTVVLPADTYYHYQLEGMLVRDRNSGRDLGYIAQILEAGGNDIYLVRNGNEEYMIPARKEFIKEVDVKNKQMIIESIPGLLSL
jgi:16S rRNA processing protein RimM